MSESGDRDLLAAEYVLGSLEGEDARQAARLLESDAAFAAAVRQWEARLAPLAAYAPPVAPPAECLGADRGEHGCGDGRRCPPRVSPPAAGLASQAPRQRWRSRHRSPRSSCCVRCRRRALRCWRRSPAERQCCWRPSSPAACW